jgi:L-asparaginase / beta-aspartyl-peptidase
MLAAEVIQGLRTETPRAAIEAALRRLSRVGGEAGGILLDAQGSFARAHNSSHFAVAWIAEGMLKPRVSLKASEEM